MSEHPCATCGEWPLRCHCDERPQPEPEPKRQICPACHGTALSPYPKDGGSCPHCFGGFLL
jgi:hypothetical protein